MTFVPYIGFALVAFAAIVFATFSLRNRMEKGGWLLAAAIAALLVGVGGGTYWMLGRPGLAVRQAQGLSTRDINGLIPFLVERVRKEPGDLQAWIYLARSYLTAGDTNNSARAYARAITVARAKGQESAELDSAYGTTLMAASGGAVNDEAMAAFSAALKLNPKDPAARFFLGQALAERGNREAALALWQSLLADIPAASPFHQTLVDQIALLTAQGGPVSAPDPKAMVANLAARLKENPKDAGGWRRLIRAYSVLGETVDAKTALATARSNFAGNKDVLAQLDADAKDLKLN